MASPSPYICARCLRFTPRISRPSRSFFNSIQKPPASTRLLHIPAQSSRRTIPTSTILITAQKTRSFSTTSTRLVPSLSTESTTSTSASSPPPPPQTPTTTTKAAGNASSSANYATTTLLNPRSDPETGDPMTIDITPRAARRLSQIMTKDSNPSLCLRVSVESGGCHGFQYLMSLEDASKLDAEEDTLFVCTDGASAGADAGGREGWKELGRGKAKVIMDSASLELLKGSKIDYTMELIGSQFKIVDNPRASSSCGCGTSFDVKI